MRRLDTASNMQSRFFHHYRRLISTLLLVSFSLSNAIPAFAGGYVDGIFVLNPALAINTGAVSVLPTFNNDQFNDRILVGAVNNDPVRTPSTSDPISTVSGNNYHDETDFAIRGRNGLNIVFTRTYNSTPLSTRNDHGLGYGWTHSYMMRIRSNDFGDCPNCSPSQKPENGNGKTSSITYTDERGGEQNFLLNESTYAVTPSKGVHDVLTLDSPVSGQHTLAFRNGVKYIFETPSGNIKTTPNITARLKFIDNPWGDRLTLNYNSNGYLSSLTDNLNISGRTGIVFTYDSNNHLKDVADWSGRQWKFSYDSSANLLTMINPLTQVLTYGYDVEKHRLTSIKKPLIRNGKSVETKFKYYENGRAFQQLNSFNLGDTLDYDLYRKATRVTNAEGNVREYFYDSNGRMTQLREPDGGVLLFENQGDAIRSQKYDALGYTTKFSYRLDHAFVGSSDTYGNVTREQDALGYVQDISYGPFDQLATIKDKRGVTTTTVFGTTTSGCSYLNRPRETRLSSLAGASNIVLGRYCWNSNGTQNYAQEYFDATRYRQTHFTYQLGTNGLNVIQEEIIGMPANLSVRKSFTYDTLGRKTTETLKRRTSASNAALQDITTAYEYDALDRVVKVTDPLGNEELNDFDANGQLWRVTHRYKKPDNSYEVIHTVTRAFDEADRVISETDAQGNSTTFSYDAMGNVIASTDAEGHTTAYEYDSMGRRTAVIDATGYRTETMYNLRGDVVGSRNANGELVTIGVDALGRKTSTTDANGYRTEFQYDANGNLVCTIDANAQANLQPKNTFGCSEYRTYDELNRVSKIVDALNGETSFSYDFTGNRLAVKDAENKTWSFAYDDLGRLVTETDHSLKSISYKSDEAGNIYEKTNRQGEITRQHFDKKNRLLEVNYLADNSGELFNYDAMGNLILALNGVVAYEFSYDKLNRLTSKVDSRGDKQLSFTYNKAGNIQSKTTYQGSTTQYVYNAANRLVMLINPDYTQINYQYDPAGHLLSRVTANGARLIQQLDHNGWLTKLSQYDAANNLLSDTTYLRDRVGNILNQTDTASTSYTYDALYRITSANYPGTANDESFTYDKVGNRKTHTKGSLIANANTRYYNYVSGTNRLAEVRIGSASGTLETSYSYNLEGQLIAQVGLGAKNLSWDAQGRLKAGGGLSYTYDPMDYRIGKNGGSTGARSYYLEGEHLELEYAGQQVMSKYLRGSNIDELVAAWLTDTDGKAKPYLYHHDHVNSVTAVSGHNGGVTQNMQYSAFGQALAGTGNSPNRLKYSGREEDQTGLYYYRARYYDPAIGRFISEDPFGFEANQVNFYAYVGNNPVNANDPTGNVANFVIGAIYGAVAGGVGGLAAAGVTNQSWQNTLISVGTGALAGGVTGLAAPWLSNQAGAAAAAAGLARTVGTTAATAFVGGSSSAIGQLSTNAVNGAPLGTNFSWGAVFGSSLGAPFSMIPAKAAGGMTGTLFGTNVNWGSQTLLVHSPMLQSSAAAVRSAVSGGVGSMFEEGAKSISNMLFPNLPVGNSTGPSQGGFLLYPNKVNSNAVGAVYAK